MGGAWCIGHGLVRETGLCTYGDMGEEEVVVRGVWWVGMVYVGWMGMGRQMVGLWMDGHITQK